jgi:hypothetical protein
MQYIDVGPAGALCARGALSADRRGRELVTAGDTFRKPRIIGRWGWVTAVGNPNIPLPNVTASRIASCRLSIVEVYLSIVVVLKDMPKPKRLMRDIYADYSDYQTTR